MKLDNNTQSNETSLRIIRLQNARRNMMEAAVRAINDEDSPLRCKYQMFITSNKNA